MKILIVGRTATGKSTLENILQKFGLNPLKSYTTRPKRNEEDTNHIFIKEEKVDKYKDKIATTEINGYKYFATKSQLDRSQVYTIDPKGLDELLKSNLTDTERFIVIHIKSDKEGQRKHFEKRNSNEDFDKRYESENKQFEEFEKKMESLSTESLKYEAINGDNKILCTTTIDNDYDIHTLYASLFTLFKIIDKVSEVVEAIRQAIATDIMPHIKRDGIIHIGTDEANTHIESAGFTFLHNETDLNNFLRILYAAIKDDELKKDLKETLKKK